MASELLAAHEAKIEEDLDGMKAKDLSKILTLEVIMKALVKN
ncbi:hypothetical protein PABG_12663 [Paracoccidioides brasiliensis Pb03]|nr:hypothetical protein PABG_12663 [Paracoccidioides brasiliensis Pb03]